MVHNRKASYKKQTMAKRKSENESQSETSKKTKKDKTSKLTIDTENVGEPEIPFPKDPPAAKDDDWKGWIYKNFSKNDFERKFNMYRNSLTFYVKKKFDYDCSEVKSQKPYFMSRWLGTKDSVSLQLHEKQVIDIMFKDIEEKKLKHGILERCGSESVENVLNAAGGILWSLYVKEVPDFEDTD